MEDVKQGHLLKESDLLYVVVVAVAAFGVVASQDELVFQMWCPFLTHTEDNY